MDQYAAFFLRFMHGGLSHFTRAEAFVFHTRLVHVAPALGERDPQKALDRLSLICQGWSGGTRIGDCLAEFNRHHAARVLGSRSVLILLSDGYDTGAPERLAREMAAIGRRTRPIDRKSVVSGTSVSGRVALCGRRSLTTKTKQILN